MAQIRQQTAQITPQRAQDAAEDAFDYLALGAGAVAMFAPGPGTLVLSVAAGTGGVLLRLFPIEGADASGEGVAIITLGLSLLGIRAPDKVSDVLGYVGAGMSISSMLEGDLPGTLSDPPLTTKTPHARQRERCQRYNRC